MNARQCRAFFCRLNRGSPTCGALHTYALRRFLTLRSSRASYCWREQDELEMPEFRVEAVPDGYGMYAAELYYPMDAKAPIGRTGAVYASPEEVRRRIEDAFIAFFNAPE